MRFAKQKGGAGALEVHHERKKEKSPAIPILTPLKANTIFTSSSP
jgi:hypothetical protein